MKNINTTSQEIVGGLLSQWLTSYLTTDGFIKDQESIINGVYQQTNLANIYCQALMAIETTYSNPTVAKLILDNIQKIYNNTFRVEPGGLYSGYNTDTGQPYLDNDRYLSNNAFVLLACCHYAYNNLGTSDQYRYKIMADGIADWIVSLQDVSSGSLKYNDYGFYSGYHGIASSTPNKLHDVKIQEANVTSIAALRSHAIFYQGRYKGQAYNAEKFLFWPGGSGNNGGLHYTSKKRFFAGKSDETFSSSIGYDTTDYLDNFAWSALMTNNIENLNNVLLGETGIDHDLYNTILLPNLTGGWQDVVNKNRIFVEGWAYMALVRMKQYLAGGSNPSPSLLIQRSEYLDSYKQFLIPSQVTSGYGVPGVSALPDYDGQLTSLAAEPALWYLLALRNINPFDPTQFVSQRFKDVNSSFQYSTNNLQI